jgi:hypothetical protein
VLKALCLISFLICSTAAASLEKNTAHDIFSTDEFKITNPPKDWTQLKIADKAELFLALQSESKDSSLTLRTFDNSDPSLKKNVVSWLRDYKSYGFRITSSKPVKLNADTYGYQIEALHKKSGKVFKQYMSIKNKKLLVLTCHSDKPDKDFSKCGESLTSFSWKTSL